jgi:NTP pyrophosphatase (non-canonical NTP hydrolase)
MIFDNLMTKVKVWAEERSLLDPDNAKAQYMKFQEEAGELARAILKNNKEDEIDAFGDVLVTLIILAEQRDIDLVSALDVAYKEISGRKGKTVNGTFIKNE